MALTSCPAGRRRRACGRTQSFRRRGRRRLRSSHRSVAGRCRLSCGACAAITGRSSCRMARTKRCGLKPWRPPARRGSIRGERSLISRRRRPRSKARSGSRLCSRWPTRTRCRQRSSRSSRPASGFNRSSRRPTRSSGWRGRDKRLPCLADLEVSKPTSRWTPPRRAWRSYAAARCSERASCRGATRAAAPSRLPPGTRRYRRVATILRRGSPTSSRIF